MPNGPTEVGLSIWEDEGNGGGREREECERGGRNVRGMGGGCYDKFNGSMLACSYELTNYQRLVN